MGKPSICREEILKLIPESDPILGRDVVEVLERKGYHPKVVQRHLRNLIETGELTREQVEGDLRNFLYHRNREKIGTDRTVPIPRSYYNLINIIKDRIQIYKSAEREPHERFLLKTLFDALSGIPDSELEKIISDLVGTPDATSTTTDGTEPGKGTKPDATSTPTESWITKSSFFKDNFIPPTKHYRERARKQDQLELAVKGSRHLYYAKMTASERDNEFDQAYARALKDTFSMTPGQVNSSRENPFWKKINLREGRLAADYKGAVYYEYCMAVCAGYEARKMIKKLYPKYDGLAGKRTQEFYSEFHIDSYPNVTCDGIKHYWGTEYLPENFTGTPEQCEFIEKRLYPIYASFCRLEIYQDKFGRIRPETCIDGYHNALRGYVYLPEKGYTGIGRNLLPQAWVEGYGKYHHLEELKDFFTSK